MNMTGGKPNDKTRLLTLSELDGRTLAAKNVRALIDAIEDDLGGSDRLSAAEQEIIRRAALATAMLEHLETTWLTGGGLDVAAWTALANVLRRLLTTVGLERRPRDVTPDLERYIADQTTLPPPPE